MAGIYLHIPFCKQKCSYCDFHFSTTFDEYRSKMVDCICLELKNRTKYLENHTIETIYFGGGTPSLLSQVELKQILKTIKAEFPLQHNVEITLEANPDDITQENLAIWQVEGINRLSIGIQSFRASDLKWMNRAHTVEEAKNCIGMAQKYGFNNLTVDLIYGLPDLSLEEWGAHVRQVVAMNVPHISAYCLTIEKNTALNAWVKKGTLTQATEDEQSDQFLGMLDVLESEGYIQYEISNFCKPGFESQHNSNYWKGEWYVGIGPSAHSYNGVSRSWNVSNNHQYMKAMLTGNDCQETEILNKIELFNEQILTGLRTMYGVRLDRLDEQFTRQVSFKDKIKLFKEKAWIYQEDGVLFLSREGKLRADYIASELFA